MYPFGYANIPWWYKYPRMETPGLCQCFSSKNTSSVTVILAFCTFVQSVTSNLRRPPPLTCTADHAAAFAVNAALVPVIFPPRHSCAQILPCTNNTKQHVKKTSLNARRVASLPFLVRIPASALCRDGEEPGCGWRFV